MIIILIYINVSLHIVQKQIKTKCTPLVLSKEGVFDIYSSRSYFSKCFLCGNTSK